MLRPYLDRLGCAFTLASVACGSGDPILGEDGGGKDGPGGPDIVCNPPPPETREIEYVVCASPLDASADADAADDGGDAGEIDAGMCITGSCLLACPPSQLGRGAGMCTDHGSDGGVHYATCTYYYLCGRRPAGARLARRRTRSAIGRYLAGAAWMEAASIRAFERLARELSAHDAPAWLVREARRAACDEARHARAMTRLARQRGERVAKVHPIAMRVRSLGAIAMENAVEGCVRETYGALLAHVQGTQAADAELRGAMRTLAPDEHRHAALALAVADWIEPRLSSRMRARVERARATARETLVREIRDDRDASIRDAIGLPTPARGVAMANTLFSH